MASLIILHYMLSLTHLSLTGFKSFAKKTTIEITHRVTGVVGPNGSGKSNIAEALRFVLGEQGMKSLRASTQIELIFKGNTHHAPASRAIVSATFLNTAYDTKKISMADVKEKKDKENETIESILSYKHIVLTRTIYKDGATEYEINGAKVRLKDVQELLALAGIGSMHTLIISQGQADTLLLSKKEERRVLLEDALGLRIFHIRLKESKKKLEKVKEYKKEVLATQKELLPRIQALHKEMTIVEKKENDKKELKNVLAYYIFNEREALHILKQKKEAFGNVKALMLIQQSLEKEINEDSFDGTLHDIHFKHKKRIQENIYDIRKQYDALARSLGKIEAEKTYLYTKNKEEKLRSERVIIENKSEIYASFTSFFKECEVLLLKKNESDLEKHIASFKEYIATIFVDKSEGNSTIESKMDDLEKEKTKIEEDIHSLTERERILGEELEHAEKEFIDEQHKTYQKEKLKRDLVKRLAELEERIKEERRLQADLEKHIETLDSFIYEYGIFVGNTDFANTEHTITEYNGVYDREKTRRSIERFRIRIEEVVALDASRIKQEHASLTSQYEYMQKELNDIEKTEEGLIHLLLELDAHINSTFKEGIKKVSHLFDMMFGKVFKGGSASLTITAPTVKKENGEYDDDEEKEGGVAISISLPDKKIDRLESLSGGEKSLASIALSFALSQLSPPPFMLLDETDAALDENNAKKYGLLLQALSEKSVLLAITHNRETMHYCDMLYGITMGSDGVSKMLSIAFDDKK